MSVLYSYPRDLVNKMPAGRAKLGVIGCRGCKCTMHRSQNYVCLDWQSSQFINIVGKDDRANPACAEGGEGRLLRGNVAGSPSQFSSCTFLNSLDLLFPARQPSDRGGQRPQRIEGRSVTGQLKLPTAIVLSSFRHPCI